MYFRSFVFQVRFRSGWHDGTFRPCSPESSSWTFFAAVLLPEAHLRHQLPGLFPARFCLFLEGMIFQPFIYLFLLDYGFKCEVILIFPSLQDILTTVMISYQLGTVPTLQQQLCKKLNINSQTFLIRTVLQQICPSKAPKPIDYA